MSLPIIGPVLKKLAAALFNWAMNKAMNIGAKIFRNKYPPDVHAKKSRLYMWENYWKRAEDKTDKSKNKLDDIGFDFVYYYNANYIEDGTLAEYLSKIECEAQEGDMKKVLDLCKEIRKLTEIGATKK